MGQAVWTTVFDIWSTSDRRFGRAGDCLVPMAFHVELVLQPADELKVRWLSQWTARTVDVDGAGCGFCQITPGKLDPSLFQVADGVALRSRVLKNSSRREGDFERRETDLIEQLVAPANGHEGCRFRSILLVVAIWSSRQAKSDVRAKGSANGRLRRRAAGS